MGLRLVLPVGEVAPDHLRITFGARRGHRRSSPAAPARSPRTHRHAACCGPQQATAGTFPGVRTFAPRRPLARTAVTVAVLSTFLAGCGLSGTDEPSPAVTGSTLGPSPSAEASDPATPAPPGGTATPTQAPTSSPTPSEPPGGNGDSESGDEPATAGGGICSDLEASDVGARLGGTVTGAGLRPRGCEFKQSDPRAPAATFVESSFAASPGGMAGAKENATASVEGEPEDLSGVGEAAFVVTGTVFGGEDVQGAGAVKVGDRLIAVSLSQREGRTRAQVRALVISLLRLAVARAG